MGDVNKEKAIFAEIFKLLGNSSYGKFIEALERQTNTSYTKGETTVDRALRSAWFKDLTEVGDAYEIVSRKPELQAQFQKCKKEWLAWDTWSNRTSGLFKLKFEGHRTLY